MKCDNKSIGKYISILYRYQQCFMGKELKKYGLGTGQYIFLLILFKKDGISQDELSKSAYIDKGTTARAIAKLENEGYVLRKKDEEDKRTNRIYLTEKALEFKPVLFKILRKWLDVLSADLNKEEEEVAIELLEKMGESAAKYMKENN
ncbi:MarR family winged helix-turn-helix transcriptional regulator [Clostridium sp. ZS2-4]|uniref:MarR family winged helix-turn-helix transcriptional regulator n=1 Tax=Clostridium sp. ZS2-4 TaxID=2987703 RepID=UPI00227C9AF9|nr:MarR family transcriptional regulator [Clostridium sp. ZS2-4]MCY6355564.1 MarR family transcriptional regulator [Clostridium sp. ZS2-4]